MQSGSEVPLPRRYRLRVAGFVLAAVVAFGLTYVAGDFLSTLKRLDVVERERDGWQRPDDILQALDLHDGDVVTDLGCGSGYFTLKLSGGVGSHGRVLAVRYSRSPSVRAASPRVRARAREHQHHQGSSRRPRAPCRRCGCGARPEHVPRTRPSSCRAGSRPWRVEARWTHRRGGPCPAQRSRDRAGRTRTAASRGGGRPSLSRLRDRSAR